MSGFRGYGEGRAVPLWDLVRTAHVVERAFTRVFAEAGLTPQQYGVLASLADDPGCTNAELARTIMVRPQSLAPVVRGMVEAGLLEQDGPGGRGRRSRLYVTDEGLARITAAWPRVAELNSEGSTGLTPAAAAGLGEALRTVRERLDGA